MRVDEETMAQARPLSVSLYYSAPQPSQTRAWRFTMFARMTTLQGSSNTIADGIKTVEEQVIPAARKMAGFKGMIALADRATGKMIGITLWESEAAMRASAEAANQLRNASAAAGGAKVLSVEQFEVVADTVA
jgi:heme-degrading monooxygenase HmoA